MSSPEPLVKLTRKDFVSDQEVRWCPGCGDYAILATMQRSLPEIGSTKENTVFVSGIGCAARFPYYMSAYGFHTIHGRAPAIATGLKLTRPELDVWLITGDGDGLSIGGNHMLHILRRNLDVQILLFNNRIYGLTKGQYSPTSVAGSRSPSTPFGSLDTPVSPTRFALGAGARFVARGIDRETKSLGPLFVAAHAHRGASFIEILQNCPIFNDDTWSSVTGRATAAESQLWLEHGKPLRFGKDLGKGLRVKAGSLRLEVVTLGENGVTIDDLLVHDETDRTLAFLLSNLEPPEAPMAFGVLYRDSDETYEHAVIAQNTATTRAKGVGDLEALIRGGHTWKVD
ncbi:MAG: 2-oxoacid:ferredoxin oxidoreductase subunit beta [Sandaracinaceae bacterium]